MTEPRIGLTLSLRDEVMGWVCPCGSGQSKAVLRGASGPDGGDVTVHCGCGRTWRLTITEQQ